MKKADPKVLEKYGVTEEELQKLGIDSYDYCLLRSFAEKDASDTYEGFVGQHDLATSRRLHLARIGAACVERIRNLTEVNNHLRKDLTILTVAANAWFMNAETVLKEAGFVLPVSWAELVFNTTASFEQVKAKIGEEGMNAMRKAGEEAVFGRKEEP